MRQRRFKRNWDIWTPPLIASTDFFRCFALLCRDYTKYELLSKKVRVSSGCIGTVFFFLFFKKKLKKKFFLPHIVSLYIE